MGGGGPRRGRGGRRRAGAGALGVALGVALRVAGAAAGAGATTCAGCRALGVLLEGELRLREEAAELERPQRGRVMNVGALPHAEAEAYLAGACGGLEARAEAVAGTVAPPGEEADTAAAAVACRQLLPQHSEALADRVFAEGAEGLAAHLCEHLSRACDPDL